MALDTFLRNWSGTVYRQIPYGSRYDLLDLRFAGRNPGNRWNTADAPTWYLAGSIPVLLAELARHLTDDRSSSVEAGTVARQIYRLTVALDAALDLRDPAVLAELDIRNAPACFLDRNIARSAAQFLRTTTPAQGIIVPSVAFLDDPQHWVLVLFLEHLPPEPRRFITAVERDTVIRLSGHSTGSAAPG